MIEPVPPVERREFDRLEMSPGPNRWKGIIGTGGNRVRIEVREVQDNGDWAFDIGSFTATAPNGDVLNSGKYLVIWKRVSGEGWKTFRDIFNWDVPPRA
jgi:ketosteroid isomerase-like protein